MIINYIVNELAQHCGGAVAHLLAYGAYIPRYRLSRTAIAAALQTGGGRGHGTVPNAHPGYFRQSARQIGVTETNDFIFGAMHRALRKQIFEGIQDTKIEAKRKEAAA